MSKTLTITLTTRPRNTDGSAGGSGSTVDITALEAAVAALQSLWTVDDAGNLCTDYNVCAQGNIAAFGTSVISASGITLHLNDNTEVEIVPRNDTDTAAAAAPLRVNELRIGNTRIYYDPDTDSLVCNKAITSTQS